MDPPAPSDYGSIRGGRGVSERGHNAMTVFFKSVNKQGGSVTGGPRVLTEQLGLDSDSTLCEIIRQAEKRGVDLTITFDQMEHRGNDAPDVNRG